MIWSEQIEINKLTANQVCVISLVESMLILILLRIIFSTVAESPASCRISNSSEKLCPKWITPQTWPFFPASRASETLAYGTCSQG